MCRDCEEHKHLHTHEECEYGCEEHKHATDVCHCGCEEHKHTHE